MKPSFYIWYIHPKIMIQNLSLFNEWLWHLRWPCHQYRPSHHFKFNYYTQQNFNIYVSRILPARFSYMIFRNPHCDVNSFSDILATWPAVCHFNFLIVSISDVFPLLSNDLSILCEAWFPLVHIVNFNGWVPCFSYIRDC